MRSVTRDTETIGDRDQLQPDQRAEMISTGMSGAPGGSQGKVSDVQECAGCHKKIHDKFVLKVSGLLFTQSLVLVVTCVTIVTLSGP